MSAPDERSARPPSGSVTDEAARLFEAVQEWAAARGQAGPDGVDGADRAAADGAVRHGGPECRYCPVCQLIALLRTTRPEVATHLAEAATALLEALRGAVVAHERDWSSRPGPPVEKIDIG